MGSLPILAFGGRGDGFRTWPSPHWVVYTGLSAADSVGYGWLDAIHPEDRLASRDAWAEAEASGVFLVEHRIRCAQDGSFRWHHTRAVPSAPLADDGPDWIGGSVDIDEVRQRFAATTADARWLRTLVDGVPQLLWRSTDMGHWTWSSRQWQAFTGQSQEESRDRGWLRCVHPDDRERTMLAWREARPHGALDVEFRVRRASDGAYFWHRTRSSPVRDAAGRITEWLGSTTDVEELKALQVRQGRLMDKLAEHAKRLEAEIAERKRAQDQLLFDAQHDGLTRLHNRSFLLARLREVLGRGDGACAVLMLDLDRFKLVNDSLGHATGDLLLREAADRLAGCLRRGDVLARFGGDEFAVLMEDGGAPGAAEAAASRIVEAMRRPFKLDGQDVFSSCSIGVVQASASSGSPDMVLRDADIAMYHAKRHGHAGFAVFTTAMRDEAVDALRLRTELRSALPNGELSLSYQPVCLAGTREVAGVEALVRWHHRGRGLVPPSNFIPVAEESGAIREIGRWVLGQACRQLRAWQDRFPGLTLRVNVNSSAVELTDPAFPAGVEGVLAETGIDPALLQIEVTESVFLRAADKAGAALARLRALGIRVGLDDFGTGYSSLAYLERYQIDTIKIDRSFVSGLAGRPRSLALVQVLLRLGEVLGLDVVAEGVEEESELRALQEAGCRLVQGYLLGTPATADAITDRLARQQKRTGSKARAK